MSHRATVFSSYRRLYRARTAMFLGDSEAMRESRKLMRSEYLKHGDSVITDAAHFQGLLGMADEAADMLRHSIVRGNLNQQSGHYEVKLKAEHVEQNTGSSGQAPLVEPITSAVVAEMENNNAGTTTVKVETTKGGCRGQSKHH